MVLNEAVYHNAGYTYAFRDDEITRLVIEFFKSEKNLAFLKDANERGIPPSAAFVLTLSSENYTVFSDGLKTNFDKRYFGTLIGAVFRTLGYVREKEKPMFLKNASTFRRI